MVPLFPGFIGIATNDERIHECVLRASLGRERWLVFAFCFCVKRDRLILQLFPLSEPVSCARNQGHAWMNKASKSRASVWKVSDKPPGTISRPSVLQCLDTVLVATLYVVIVSVVVSIRLQCK